MRTGQSFWPGVQISLHDFYIQMIAEDAFKNKFADIFVSQYPELMQTFKDSKTKGSVTLLDLSVQIFTVMFHSHVNVPFPCSIPMFRASDLYSTVPFPCFDP